MEHSSLAIATAIKWTLGIVPAALGSAISLKVSGCKGSITEMLVKFTFGLCIAYYFGGATLEYFKIATPSFLADAIKLTWGLFGMGIITQIFTQMPDFVSAVRRKFIGD